LKFLMENIWLIALVLGSGAMLLWPVLRGGASGTKEVTPAEAVALINRENALVLDVRNEDEFAGGHIADARNIPVDKLQERLNELRKYQQKPLVVNCLSGMRTVKACNVLKKSGFTNIYNLKGGINAWKQANLPLTKD
jgi:rhodanese-related sulfurtransferase